MTSQVDWDATVKLGLKSRSLHMTHHSSVLILQETSYLSIEYSLMTLYPLHRNFPLAIIARPHPSL
jgi:hypothetical protein